MSLEDLAIDVGLAKDTDEYDSFINTVHNILELSCGYSEKIHHNIIEKCNTSELNIAKKVIKACKNTRSTRIRESKLKWWQTYQPKEYITEDIYIDRNPEPASKDRHPKRPMSPMFKGDRRRQRPNVQHRGKPRGVRNRHRKRPMSPMFERNNQQNRVQRDRPRYRDQHSNNNYNRNPQYRKRNRHDEPSVEYERNSNHKRNYEDRYDRPVSYGNVPEWGSSKKRRRYN